jgi:hypothetical protein
MLKAFHIEDMEAIILRYVLSTKRFSIFKLRRDPRAVENLRPQTSMAIKVMSPLYNYRIQKLMNDAYFLINPLVL